MSLKLQFFSISFYVVFFVISKSISQVLSLQNDELIKKKKMVLHYMIFQLILLNTGIVATTKLNIGKILHQNQNSLFAEKIKL